MSVVTGRYARALADAVFNQKVDALKTAAALHGLEALLESSHELRGLGQSVGFRGAEACCA